MQVSVHVCTMGGGEELEICAILVRTHYLNDPMTPRKDFLYLMTSCKDWNRG